MPQSALESRLSALGVDVQSLMRSPAAALQQLQKLASAQVPLPDPPVFDHGVRMSNDICLRCERPLPYVPARADKDDDKYKFVSCENRRKTCKNVLYHLKCYRSYPAAGNKCFQCVNGVLI